MYALLFVMLPLMAIHNCEVFSWRSFKIWQTGHRWANNQRRNSTFFFAIGAFSSYSIEMLLSPTWVPELKRC
jgi:hypothetical protein